MTSLQVHFDLVGELVVEGVGVVELLEEVERGGGHEGVQEGADETHHVGC